MPPFAGIHVRSWRSSTAATRSRSPGGRIGGAHRADLSLHRGHERCRIVDASRLDHETWLTCATNVGEGIAANDDEIRKLPHLDRPEPVAESHGACTVDGSDAKDRGVRNTGP